MKRKKVRTVLKKGANEFTEKIAEFIKGTGWEFGTETTKINPKKLDKTKITIEFEISEEKLEEIKAEVNRQTSLDQYSPPLEEEIEEET